MRSLRLLELKDALVLANRTYRADGTLATQGWGNGLSETRSYDLAGQLTTWSLGTPENRTMTYDAVGNILTIGGSLGATYTYDSLDRLASETGTGITQAFTWDANGNRLSDGAGGYSYTPNTNRETTSPQGAVVVDGAGYMTSDRGGARTFTWSAAGDMDTATMSGATATYAYRDDHLRASKTVGGSTTLYHYDLNGRLIAETTAAGAAIREYVWDDDVPVAQVTAGTLAYLHTDQLGTPRLATNAAKTVVWRWNGKAFGESAPAVGTITVNLRFPGQYFDAETGLHYNWHRYYDPAAGRYLSSDPVGVEAGINTFGYVGGNPLRFMDTLGLELVPISLPGLPNTYIDDEFKPKVLEFITNARTLGVELKFNYAYRTPAVQAALRNNPSAITPATQSLHSCGFAVDINFKSRPADEQQKILQAARDAGLSWGGNFSRRPDWPHFYIDPGFSRTEVIERAYRTYLQLEAEKGGK